METVLITGANRGLGLEFARQYAAAGWRVLATCRDPAAAVALQRLAETEPRVSLQALDVQQWAAVDALAERLAGEPIDVLINNAGIYGDTAEHRFGSIDYDQWERVLRVNTIAPVKLAEALQPHLRRGQRRLIVAITSLMGSIGDNGSGGSILYRSSKAALNAAMKSLAIDLRPAGIGVLILHPGWVRTDMGGANAPTSPAESIAGMRRIIESFEPRQSGRFLNFRGEELPW